MNYTIVQCDVCGRKNRSPMARSGIPRCGNCGSPLPWITEADDCTFHDVIEASDLPVVVDLWAPWCGPCRAVTPILERLAHSYAGRLKLTKVNADVATGVGQRFDARAIPTLLVMSGGNVVSRQIGAAPEPQLRAWLDQALSTIGAST